MSDEEKNECSRSRRVRGFDDQGWDINQRIEERKSADAEVAARGFIESCGIHVAVYQPLSLEAVNRFVGAAMAECREHGGQNAALTEFVSQINHRFKAEGRNPDVVSLIQMLSTCFSCILESMHLELHTSGADDDEQERSLTIATRMMFYTLFRLGEDHAKKAV